MLSGTRALVLVLLQVFLVSSVPAKSQSQDTKPVLKLPYGSFEATEQKNDIWTFKNIPYAAPPVGDLRWAKPATPVNKTGIQGGNRKGASCLQAGVHGLNVVGNGNGDELGQMVNQIIGSVEAIVPTETQSEDCLFLDMQVPDKAIKDPSLKLPVVVYIFGGGFVTGDKDILQPLLPLYDGTGMLKQSGKDFIFLSFNYRLGALGFLAGTTMERDGLPNAGLWDQRAVFEWVQSYIYKVGGDPEQVTAMGESAGASSILFHLVAKGGRLDPLFNRAILLSPAFEPMWDRAGIVEGQFQRFTALAGCRGKGISCLRNARTETLDRANEQLMAQQTPGSFAVGPTPDGAFIRQLPVLELATSNFWPLDSMILSHCAEESIVFVNGAVKSNGDFDKFLSEIFPNYIISQGLLERAIDAYPAVGAEGSPYKKQTDRMEAFLRDSSMTCNIRYLVESLGPSKTWVMQYSVAPGWHGTDLIVAFFMEDFDMSSIIDFVASVAHIAAGFFLRGLSRAYQSLLTSYIITGDPNRKRFNTWDNLPYPGTIHWSRPKLAGNEIDDVLNVDYGLFKFFSGVEDGQMPKDKCDFWKEFNAAATVAGGYAPMGVVLDQEWVDDEGASTNYVGGNTGN